MNKINELESIFKKLQEMFEKDIEIEDEMLDHVSISIPKKMSKYIAFYHECLSYISTLKDEKDALYYQIMHDYRLGNNQLSRINWSATELKQIIESTKDMRDLNNQTNRTEAMLKTVEKMMSELKNVSFAINNSLTYKKIMNGMI